MPTQTPTILATSVSMPLAAPGPSGFPAQTTAISQLWRDSYRLTEGHTSQFMLTSSAFSQVPNQFKPGQDIQITGVRLNRTDVTEIWSSEETPANLLPAIGDDEDHIFWIHPLSLSPPDLPPDMQGSAVARRVSAIHKHKAAKLRGLVNQKRTISGKAVVSSSVRSVLLYEVDGEELESPLEVKLSLPVYIYNVERSLSSRDIGGVWRIHEQHAEAATRILFASALAGSVEIPGAFDEMGPKPSTFAGYTIGQLCRDAGCKVEGNRVHLQVPYFSLFGDGSDSAKSLLMRLYENYKTRGISSSPEEFVIEHFISPAVSLMLDMMNEGRCFGGGLHYQNPAMRFSFPYDDIDTQQPLAWADSDGMKFEGMMMKELEGLFLKNSTVASFEQIEVLMSNLWYYFVNDIHWAASFSGFDRCAFKRSMLDLLNAHAPKKDAPENVDQKLWETYKGHFKNIVKGLNNRHVALANEVHYLSIRNNPLGMSFCFARGSKLFVFAPPGMDFETPEQFTLMYDKIAFMTVADPDIDIHGLVEHENALFQEAKRKVSESGTDEETDSAYFFRTVLDEFYSESEIDRMRGALMQHSGLQVFSQADREWMADFIFDPDNGVFSKQLAAFKALSPNRQRKVDYEHLPRVGYWFGSISYNMIRARVADPEGDDVGPALVESKQFNKSMRARKTYDKTPWYVRLRNLFAKRSASTAI